MVRDKPAHGSTIPADVTDELAEYTGAFLYGKTENKPTKIRGIALARWFTRAPLSKEL